MNLKNINNKINKDLYANVITSKISYIYIYHQYIYKTEAFEAPTIFHVTTIAFFKILFILFI